MDAIYDQWKNLSDKINNEIPIEDVLNSLGFQPVSKGKYRLREDDKTASASVFKKKNLIKDFGDDNTLNCCALIAWYEGISYKEATAKLAQMYGYEIPEKGTEAEEKLSVRDWAQLNIQGDMVSKNMNFYPNGFNDDRTRELANSYRMSMTELKDRIATSSKDKDVYTDVIRARAFPRVIELRNQYYASLYNWYVLSRDMGDRVDVEALSKNESFVNDAKELSFAERVLARAVNGTGINAERVLIKTNDGDSVRYEPHVYNVKNDFYKVVNGKIAFEMGPHSQYDIYRAADKEKTKVFYCLVSLDEYYKLVENGLDNMQYAAKQRGDEISLAFVATDSSRVNYLIRALRGKERNIIENLNAQEQTEQKEQEDVVVRASDDVRSDKVLKPSELGIT